MNHVANNGWEPCPRCESKRVVTRGKLFFFFVFFAGGGCLSWLAIIFLPILFISIPIVLLSPLAFLLPKTNQCQDCQYAWRVNKKKKQDIAQ